MKEISLHILDIAENSVNAGASKITITINENFKKDELSVVVSDNGKGMDTNTVAVISDPFITTRKTRKVGLGIPFFKAAAEMCNGYLKIESTPNLGTKISTSFQHSHIDRMPLGDINSTILNLLIGYPDINWIFEFNNDENKFTINDKVIKDTLGEIPLSDPLVIKYLKEVIADNFESIRG